MSETVKHTPGPWEARALMARIERMSVPEPNSGCWIWLAQLSAKGYGRINIAGRPILAHRASWHAQNGEIPNGKLILHHCDNRACVNPDHLYPGTQKQNMADALRRGRFPNFKGLRKGSLNPSAKIHETDVGVIKSLLASGMKQDDIAAIYGLARSSISNVKRGVTWNG